MAMDVVLRIARSAIPVSVLYIGKLIIDQVVLLTRGGHAAIGRGFFGLGSRDGTHFLWHLLNATLLYLLLRVIILSGRLRGPGAQTAAG